MEYAIQILKEGMSNLIRISLQKHAMLYHQGILTEKLDYKKEIAELEEAILTLQLEQQTK
jgi:hypothetical protein